MIIISYDIKDDKLRQKLCSFIKRFGNRLQYSVYEIENSDRILKNIIAEIKYRFENQFSEEDSVIIFKMSNSCEITRMGYAKHDEKNVMFVK